MKLPCDNLDDFLNGKKRFYRVQENTYQVGDTVTLYNGHKEHEFDILNIVYDLGDSVLALEVRSESLLSRQ